MTGAGSFRIFKIQLILLMITNSCGKWKYPKSNYVSYDYTQMLKSMELDNKRITIKLAQWTHKVISSL